MVETYGLPLDILLDNLNKKYYTIDWIDFIEQGLQVWSWKTLFNKIKEAITDVYDSYERDEILKRVLFYYKMRSKE